MPRAFTLADVLNTLNDQLNSAIDPNNAQAELLTQLVAQTESPTISDANLATVSTSASVAVWGTAVWGEFLWG